MPGRARLTELEPGGALFLGVLSVGTGGRRRDRPRTVVPPWAGAGQAVRVGVSRVAESPRRAILALGRDDNPELRRVLARWARRRLVVARARRAEVTSRADHVVTGQPVGSLRAVEPLRASAASVYLSHRPGLGPVRTLRTGRLVFTPDAVIPLGARAGRRRGRHTTLRAGVTVRTRRTRRLSWCIRE